MWSDPYGDRQIELVIFLTAKEPAQGLDAKEQGLAAQGPGLAAQGPGLDEIDKKLVEQLLMSCLVTDAEYAAGQEVWNMMEDPFSYSY